jgi:hypothetical protein
MVIDKISLFISRLCFEFDGKVTHFYDKTGFILIIFWFHCWYYEGKALSLQREMPDAGKIKMVLVGKR